MQTHKTYSNYLLLKLRLFGTAVPPGCLVIIAKKALAS